MKLQEFKMTWSKVWHHLLHLGRHSEAKDFKCSLACFQAHPLWAVSILSKEGYELILLPPSYSSCFWWLCHHSKLCLEKQQRAVTFSFPYGASQLPSANTGLIRVPQQLVLVWDLLPDSQGLIRKNAIGFVSAGGRYWPETISWPLPGPHLFSCSRLPFSSLLCWLCLNGILPSLGLTPWARTQLPRSAPNFLSKAGQVLSFPFCSGWAQRNAFHSGHGVSSHHWLVPAILARVD